jgi:hypothetical protein
MPNKTALFLLKLRIYLVIVVIMILLSFKAFASTKGSVTPLVNHVYRENIRTVQFVREGWDFSMPEIELGSDQRLLLKFDEVGNDVSNFVYTITHCDFEWYPSRLVQSDYMEGFIENPISDYAASMNTTLRYTNYILTLPNDNVRFLISGNYLLSVFDERDRSVPVLTRRFYIVEPLTDIRGEVKSRLSKGIKVAIRRLTFPSIIHVSELQIPAPKLRLL